MAAVNFVRIGGMSGRALPTRVCVSCGASAGVTAVAIPRTFPFGLLFGIAFALPLLLALVLDLAWGSRDLYSIMAGTGGRNATELAIFRALPVAVATLWSIAAIVALEVFCRRAGLRLSLCRPCAGRQRRRRAALVATLALSFVALAAALYLVPMLALYDRKWGILFAPWAILAALLAGETPLAGIRIRAVSDEVWRILGAPASTAAIAVEHPDRAVTAGTPFWPPRLELWSLTVPVALAAVSILGPGSSVFRSNVRTALIHSRTALALRASSAAGHRTVRPTAIPAVELAGGIHIFIRRAFPVRGGSASHTANSPTSI